ncbi:hypothetical protein RD792_013324 [Penstemon davidsonii]|uniref:protein-serine/threonine phosphatase n=1 Tax=Penstemon davidsonii TaxID=160366 RepID=A0ABR0CT50_9LAMI|nr:hypothetical protein RD792_013324 [Penstemon davidsonii]
MAGMCYGVNMGETETSTPVEPSSKSARRRRMEIHQFNFVPKDSAVAPPPLPLKKRQRIETVVAPVPPQPRSCGVEGNVLTTIPEEEEGSKTTTFDLSATTSDDVVPTERPKFGMTSVCGRRRDMEDSVAIHPSFCDSPSGMHFFGVYDGHGCSHVATKCKDRMHEIVRDEYGTGELSWEHIMNQSFSKMDKEVTDWPRGGATSSTCRCELQTPHCDAVGSTAVVAVVTPDKIIVSNCGDSRAVLCRNGVAIPLSETVGKLGDIGPAGPPEE